MCFPCSYELMQKCWSLDPDQRPTPIDIVASLTPLDSPAQDVNDEIKEIVEEDCKTNGVKANGRQHLGEYYNCPLVRQTVVSFFLSHTFSHFLSFIFVWLTMYSSHSPHHTHSLLHILHTPLIIDETLWRRYIFWHSKNNFYNNDEQCTLFDYV